MSPFPVLDAPSGWRIAPDTPAPAAANPFAILMVALRDEITGLPPSPPPAASTTTVGLLAKTGESGLAGLVAPPLRRYEPGFITGAPLNLSLAGAGFSPVTFDTTIGAEPGYPATFTPVDLGVIELHRAPVSIGGRTVSRARAVRAGSIVTVDGIWLTLADLTQPPAAPNLVALASPLYAGRDTTATVAAQTLTIAPPGEAKRLSRPVNVGDTTVHLTDVAGLAVGSVLALDPEDTARAEYLAITALTPPGAVPAEGTLAFPATRPHAAGATAIRMIPGATGAPNALALPARAADVTLVTAALSGLDATTTAVVISGGGAADEFHPAGLVTAISDANGQARLPPLHRVARLRLRVHHPAEPIDLTRDVMPPLGVAAMTIALVFP